MRLEELYPYWQDAHDDLLETVKFLTDAQMDEKPAAGTASLRDLLLDFLYQERYWISQLIAGNAIERPRTDRYPDAASLVEALTAARQVTRHVLEPFSREGLRAVRHVPADPQSNQPETNMPVAWLIWHVLEREIAVHGQIRLRLDNSRGRR